MATITDDGLWRLRTSLLDALDQISSTRSSMEIRSAAFETIERHLAAALSNKDDKEGLDHFLALQYTFECNVPLRLLSWISLATTQLDNIMKGSVDESQEAEASVLAAQLTQGLSLIQGITLSHAGCKDYLGRKYAIEVLLDLLLASRHLPTPSDTDSEACRKLSLNSQPLTSIVLDTLLCILVDSSPALRAFEDAHGPQAVVRILKRANTPREVRMKCLEFLYFYLLDETTPTSPTEESDSEKGASLKIPPPLVPTAPATPIPPPKHYAGIGITPRRPAPSTYGSSTYAFSETSSGKTSRSTSGSSTLSFSSTSSNASSSTTPSSLSSSPEKSSGGRTALVSRSLRKSTPRLPSEHSISQRLPKTPPTSPPAVTPKGPAFRFPAPLQPRMMMLKKEVEYEPMSPKKADSAKPRPPARSASSSSSSRHLKSKSMSNVLSNGAPERVKSRLGSAATVPEIGNASLSFEMVAADLPKQPSIVGPDGVKRRTTEEKKELLGTMLGNVDALVEGVRKAGIWGLG